MRRIVIAAFALMTFAGCTRPTAPTSAVAISPEVNATPLDDLVATIAADESRASKLCLGGKASACQDQAYATRSLTERGYCKGAGQASWTKCPKSGAAVNGS
jgi:hypothetical protein